MSNNTEDSGAVFLYHEKQATGLCGVHCLNSLLQGPVYNEVALMRFAQELDEDERRLMAAEGYDTKDFLKYMSEDSFNVSDNGNFSVQVLLRALQLQKLPCRLMTNSNYYDTICNLNAESAFVINKGEHWFTIRKVADSEWFNFNSFLSEPEHMSQSDLGSFLDSLYDQKSVAIYAIQGTLPAVSATSTGKTSPDGRWVRAKGVKDLDIKVAMELSKASAQTSTPQEAKPANSGSISYPKLDTSGGTVGYPKLESKQDNNNKSFTQSAASSSTTAGVTASISPVAPTPSSNGNLQEMLLQMNGMLNKFAGTMDSLDQRLTKLEKSFGQIQSNQKNH